MGFAYTLHIAKEVKFCHVNLLMIGNDDEIKHYCWIKYFICLASAQYSSYDGELANFKFLPS